MLLYCNDNALTVLPALPAGLLQLSCDGNELTALPTLPPPKVIREALPK